MVEYIAYTLILKSHSWARIQDKFRRQGSDKTIEFLRSVSLTEYEYTLSTQLQSITETQGW